MENLTKFYTALVTSLDVIVEAETGNCYSTKTGTRMPVTIGGKHLFIPNQNVLQRGIREDQIGFHPLSENALFGESEVLSALRSWVMQKITDSTAGIVEDLLAMATSKTRQVGLSPKQSKFLAVLPSADSKMENLWNGIMKKYDPDEYSQRIVSIYLKRGGQSGDITYNRSANVNMPWLANASERQLMGIKNVRKRDVENLTALMEQMFPGLTDSWMIGSLNQTSPFTHSLLLAYKALAEHVNKAADLFGSKQLTDYEEIRINLDWVDGLDNLEKLKVEAPPLPGNTGEQAKDAPEVDNAVVVAPPTAPAFPPANSGYPQPPVGQNTQMPNTQPTQPQPAAPTVAEAVTNNASSTGKSYKLSEITQKAPQPYVQQPPQQQVVYTQAPPQQPVAYGQPQQPVYTQAPPQQQVVYTQAPPQQPVTYGQPQQVYSQQPMQAPANMSPGRAQARQQQQQQYVQQTYGQPQQTVYGQPPQQQIYGQPPQQQIVYTQAPPQQPIYTQAPPQQPVTYGQPQQVYSQQPQVITNSLL